MARINHLDEYTEIDIFLFEGYMDGTALCRWVAKYINYFQCIDIFIRKQYTSSMNIRLKPGLVTRYISTKEQAEIDRERMQPEEGAQESTPEATPEALPEITPEA